MQEMRPNLRVTGDVIHNPGMSALRWPQIAETDLRADRPRQKCWNHGCGTRPRCKGRTHHKLQALEREDRGLSRNQVRQRRDLWGEIQGAGFCVSSSATNSMPGMQTSPSITERD